MARRSTRPITVRTLKDIGLFSPFDVSKWCATHGIQSVYLEHQKEKIMDVSWTYMTEPGWVVRDAKEPGKVIKRFTFSGESTITDVRKRAEAWIEANYDVPMKYLHVVRSSFSTPAVDLILDEIEIMRRVWSPEPTVQASIPKDVFARFLAEHPAPPKSLRKEGLLL